MCYTVTHMKKSTVKENLIEEFFRTEIENYSEPQRRGTSRGDPIGFSKVKYSASLFSLTDKDLKEVARSLSVSYGLLRKWRTEDQFKKMVNKHVEKFSVIFYRHILELVIEDRKRQEEFLSKPLEEIASSQLPQVSRENRHRRISSYLSYSPILQKKIGQIFLKINEGKTETLLKMGVIRNEDEMPLLMLGAASFVEWIGDLSRKLEGRSKNPDEEKLALEITKMSRESLYAMAQEIIMKREITDEDRKQLLYVCKLMQ
jgi:hypothetical protein